MNKRKYTFDTSGFSCQNTDCHKYHIRAVALELPEESLVSARIQFLLGLKQQVKIH